MKKRTGEKIELRQKKLIVDNPKFKRRIGIYGGSFNPPAKHHRAIVEAILSNFDLIVIVPCGNERPDKDTVNLVSAERRRDLVKLNFRNIKNLLCDFKDLQLGIFRPTIDLDREYKKIFPHSKIWHIIGSDLIAGGSLGRSEVQREWHKGRRFWQKANFFIIHRPGYEISPRDRPPHTDFFFVTGIVGSGTVIRERLIANKSMGDLLLPAVEAYIRIHHLYGV